LHGTRRSDGWAKRIERDKAGFSFNIRDGGNRSGFAAAGATASVEERASQHSSPTKLIRKEKKKKKKKHNPQPAFPRITSRPASLLSIPFLVFGLSLRTLVHNALAVVMAPSPSLWPQTLRLPQGIQNVRPFGRGGVDLCAFPKPRMLTEFSGFAELGPPFFFFFFFFFFVFCMAGRVLGHRKKPRKLSP